MIKITKSLFDYNIYILSSNKRSSNYYVESDEKSDILSKNLSSYYRAKNTIRDYAKNNNFNYFITITLDSEKIDITDESAIKKKLLKYFNNLKNRVDTSFKYIIVAERGKKNNRLHFHGLVILNNKNYLHHISFGRYRDNWLYENFGANCFIPINNYSLKVVNYISKYITKDSYLSHVYKFNYFCSNGLKKSKVVYSYDNGIEFSSNNFNSSIANYLLKWLSDNNMIQDYQFCSYSNLTINMFNDFIKSHNLINDSFFKQLDFSDLVFMREEVNEYE